ncbi:hypothetical protein TNCV_4620811 [Trichonephila clavipes]|nr:hypothetical protein TNCV_4620811 [Trichonephila clavipes]
MKSLVYASSVNSDEALVVRIAVVAGDIREMTGVFTNVRQSLHQRLQGFNLKNRKDISYPTIIRSAIRPVPHGPDLPIPSPPDTLDNILNDLDQISHISSDSDDGYDPGTKLFS